MSTKIKILSALQKADGYLSGQQLCDELGVSRTAIWKVINQLKEDGYEIESVARKGYRILKVPDLLTAEQVGSLLETQWIGTKLYYYDKIDSTNNAAKRLAEDNAPNGTLVLADCQESGKGRRGRCWSTPSGTAIAMSILVRPSIPPERASMLTLVIGMAVAEVCREQLQIPAQIKWPNDVVVEGRKISGTLTEMSSEIDSVNYVVIGTGINVNQTEFPEEICQVASSLYQITGKIQDRAQIVAACMKKLEEYYALFVKTQDMSLLKEHYNELLAGKDTRVRILEPGNEHTGISRGINERGELLVQREDGTMEQIYSGEVSVRGIYGYSG